MGLRGTATNAGCSRKEEKGNELLQSVSCGLVEGGGVVMVELWRRGRGGSIQCMQFHVSYISPPTNQQTHPHQDTKIGIIFPELISLCRFQATVYLEHSCYILISVFLGVGNIDR